MSLTIFFSFPGKSSREVVTRMSHSFPYLELSISRLPLLQRRWRDLNPRAGYPTYRISSADPSATWVHLQQNICVTVQYLHSSMFYYGQRSKGADLLNNYASTVIVYMIFCKL